MANQWGYDEKYMHAQNHPLWGGDVMGRSGQTLRAKGCFIDCLTYIRSRKENKDYGLREQNKAMGVAGGYNSAGDTLWDVVKRIMRLSIFKTKPAVGRVFTMRNVWVRGRNNAVFSHWVVELAGGLMFDPLQAGGNFVHKLDFYPPVFIRAGVINRRYVV